MSVQENVQGSQATLQDVSTYPFKLTDEQEHLRREIRDFAQRAVDGKSSNLRNVIAREAQSQ